jgi:hypothetical protein
MMEEKAGVRRSEWLELFCFMSSSARGLIQEPQIYGPFRLLDSLERLIGLLADQGVLDDEFLQKEREKINRNKLLLMADRQAFVALLDEVVADFTRELKDEAG